MTIPDHEVARRRSRLSLFRGNWRRGYAPVEIFLSSSSGTVARRQAPLASLVLRAGLCLYHLVPHYCSDTLVLEMVNI